MSEYSHKSDDVLHDSVSDLKIVDDKLFMKKAKKFQNNF